MQVKNTLALFIVVEVFLINLTELHGASGGKNANNGFNWFEAQKNCSGRGLRLSTGTELDNQDYWTGHYKRLSDWIKIIGCYPDVNITNHVHRVQKIMAIKSVGACQEICKNENATTFAVKSNRCNCLKGNVRFEAMSQLLPSKCNFTCDNEDGIYSKDCGGEEAHNIFISYQNNTFVNYENCMVLQCSSGDPKYLPNKCSNPLGKICQNLDTSAEVAGYSNWTNSMNLCKDSSLPSYLNGDLHLTNANGTCQTLPQSDIQLRWIGIARQIYKKEDEGWTIKEEEQNSLQSCLKCANKAKCSYIPCPEKINNIAFCINRTEEINVTSDIITTDIFTRQSMGTESTTTEMAEKQTTAILSIPIPTVTQSNHHLTTINENIDATKEEQTSVGNNNGTISQSREENDDIGNTLIPIILGLVIPVMAIVLLIIYIRRRTNSKKGKDKNKQPKGGRVNNPQAEINNPSYFVLEKPSSYELADESMLDSESPYNEAEEGEYDHLRNKDSRKKDEDDTYQHATSISNGDVSHYDYTTTNQGEGDKKIEKSKKIISPELREDSTYTEVDTAPPDTYFVLEKTSPYDLAANSTLDCDSPYNETEEGEYDHLRKKDFRKKIVDDTYQHATPVINADASLGHYGTTFADKNQEVESNYDHMHESLNFNINSENRYNYTT